MQEAFDQAVRQRVARALVERVGDALVEPGGDTSVVRVPDDADETTRRGAEEVPLCELASALAQAASRLGPTSEDELTILVAKLFGWTRRGGAIQERLDAALVHAVDEGALTREGGMVRAAG